MTAIDDFLHEKTLMRPAPPNPSPVGPPPLSTGRCGFLAGRRATGRAGGRAPAARTENASADVWLPPHSPRGPMSRPAKWGPTERVGFRQYDAGCLAVAVQIDEESSLSSIGCQASAARSPRQRPPTVAARSAARSLRRPTNLASASWRRWSREGSSPPVSCSQVNACRSVSRAARG
jgi:hypothetical protein